MVSFNCSRCGDTIKKKKAEQHLYKCRRAVLSCVDCGREFRDGSYAEHFKCLTEAQKYEKPGTQFEQSKGEKVQMSWFENVQAACLSNKCSPKCYELLRQLQDYPNTPRKRAKFMNFVTNSIRGYRTEHIEEAWNIISEFSSKKKDEDGASKCNGQNSDNAPASQGADQPAEDKHSVSEEGKKKLEPSANSCTEVRPCEDVNGVEKKKKKSKREVYTESTLCPEETDNGKCESPVPVKEKKKRKKTVSDDIACEDQITKQPNGEDQAKTQTAPDEETVPKKKHRKHKHTPEETEECDPLVSREKKKRHSTEVNESVDTGPPIKYEEKDASQEDLSKKKKKHKRRDRDSSDAKMLTTKC